MKKIEYVLLATILIAAFITRLYRLDKPIGDWHSWRQVDTSAVSRTFVQDGFDILHPRYHDLSNIPSGVDNPQGYRFVEFPLFNVTQAGFYVLFDFFSLEQWGRLTSIIASLLSVLFIYLIAKRHSDVVVGLLSAFFYAVLPFNVYYGRVLLPDVAMTSAILGGIYFFDLWIEKSSKFDPSTSSGRDPSTSSGRDPSTTLRTGDQSSKFEHHYFIISLLFTSAAFLLKPYALFFTLPMIYLAWRTFGLKMFIRWQLWVFFVLSISPLIFWRIWIQQFPEGIPGSKWLFNGGDIRFSGAFFYWIFADRIGRLILGYWGLALFIIGLLVNSARGHVKKNGIFFYTFLLSSLLYIVVIARGNVQHDYYQILIIPSIAVFLGLGARALLLPHPEFINKIVSRSLFLVITAFTVSFSWYFVRDYYIVNETVVNAGRAADKLLPTDAKVIAPVEGDTTLLYYTGRKGWPSFQHPIPELIAKGATHLVLINPSEKDHEVLGREYKIIASEKEYIIFDLRSTP